MENKQTTYIQDAIRTESIEGAKERIGKCLEHFGTLEHALNLITNEIDALKKYIYYGKESSILDTNRLDLRLDVKDYELRLLHAGLGMLTEAEEFLTPVVNSILHSKDIDYTNLKEELGDMQWYQAIACDVLGTTLEIEQDRNIAKLKTRYPGKYSNDKAINRDLIAEREVLENNSTNRIISMEGLYLPGLGSRIRLLVTLDNKKEVVLEVELIRSIDIHTSIVIKCTGYTLEELENYLYTIGDIRKQVDNG